MLNDENAPVPSVYNREHKAYGKETTYTIAPVILWDSTRVWKILTAYVYTGAMVLGKSRRLISGKPISRIVPKGQQYITEGTHEAVSYTHLQANAASEFEVLPHIGQVRPSGLDGKSSYSELLEILRKWILWRDTDQGNESARLFFVACFQ